MGERGAGRGRRRGGDRGNPLTPGPAGQRPAAAGGGRRRAAPPAATLRSQPRRGDPRRRLLPRTATRHHGRPGAREPELPPSARSAGPRRALAPASESAAPAPGQPHPRGHRHRERGPHSATRRTRRRSFHTSLRPPAESSSSLEAELSPGPRRRLIRSRPSPARASCECRRFARPPSRRVPLGDDLLSRLARRARSSGAMVRRGGSCRPAPGCRRG